MDKYGYIGIEILLNFCENSKDHAVTPNDFMRMKRVRMAEPHWIPCSERLPEEREWIGTKEFGTTISDEVYVTIEVSPGKRITKHMCFENGSIPAFEQRSIDVFYKGGKVVAWMPLPEPYREGVQE